VFAECHAVLLPSTSDNRFAVTPFPGFRRHITDTDRYSSSSSDVRCRWTDLTTPVVNISITAAWRRHLTEIWPLSPYNFARVNTDEKLSLRPPNVPVTWQKYPLLPIFVPASKIARELSAILIQHARPNHKPEALILPIAPICFKRSPIYRWNWRCSDAPVYLYRR